MSETMTSMERVLTTLSHKEPDRVPFFLLLTLHGAKELNLSIKEYFSKAEYIVEGQVRLRAKYQHDCYYPFTYAGLEVEAFGGDVHFIDDGPPNAGAPIIQKISDIDDLIVPEIEATPCLTKVLDVIGRLHEKAKGEVPIIGVAMSPFSAPVMQMGFSAYLDLLIDQPQAFWTLMEKNEQFCVNWANAQLAAGATAICYFDPVSSPTMVSPQMYGDTGLIVSRRTIAKINGPVATHFASGRCLDILPDVISTKSVAVGVGEDEEIAYLKEAGRTQISIIGNLNGIKMCRWSAEEARKNVVDVIDKAAPGGGFILSDGHGEIPWGVSSEVLSAISETVRRYGIYGAESIVPKVGS
ncbi:uroporphyrinogen decarboxylase family protein [Desulforhopalus sp. 52FAK]